MPNGVWAGIITIVLAGFTYLAWRTNRPRFLIVLIHNAIWAGALVLIGSNLIAYKESSAIAWLTLSCGIVLFNVGAWVARWRVRDWWPFNLWRSSTVRELPVSTGVNALMTRRTLLIVVLVYAAAFAVYLLNIALRFGLLTLITNPISIRGFQGESYLESVPLIVRILLYLGPLLLVVFGYRASLDRPLPLTIRIIAMVLLVVSMLALLQRTNLFMGVLWLIAVLITQPLSAMKRSGPTEPIVSSERSRRPGGGSGWKIALVAVALVAVAFGAFQAVGGALHKSGQQALSTTAVSEPLRASGLTSPFTYYTAGTVAFLQLVDSPNHEWPPSRVQGGTPVVGNYNPQTWGASTFAPVLKAIPGVRTWDMITPFIDTAVWTNVYTWVEPYYRDFRLPGVVLGMFLLGLLIARLYSRRFESARIFWIQSAFISTIFLATFITKINNTLFLSELIFVFLLTIRWPNGSPRNWLKERRGAKADRAAVESRGKV